MIDWTKSMIQTFEYYIVDPRTWGDDKKLTNVKSCTINYDSTASTLGSATIDITGDIEECYVRIYLVAFQNGETDKRPLGTFLVQTPSSSFDGKITENSLDAYTPLIELGENPPPIGYSINKDQNIMDIAYRLIREHVRCPVVKTECETKLTNHFVSNTDDTWLTFISDLIANAKYSFELDDLSRILFSPNQGTASLQPVHTFNDGNSSILYPKITKKRDLYGIPNVIEVSYSNNNKKYYSRVVNNDPNSPISTVNRGREITKRITDPQLTGVPTQGEIDLYAKQLLKEASTLEYEVTYTHGYYPVKIGQCVRLNHEKFGLNGVKARIITQSIKCEPGCPVTETAVYTEKLWG